MPLTIFLIVALLLILEGPYRWWANSQEQT